MLDITPIAALKDNYIWMLSDKTANIAWVVDPGDAIPVIENLNKHNYTLLGIFLTHHHADHSAGVRELLNYAGNIPVFGSPNSSIQYINHPVNDNDTIVCSSFHLKAIEIPGHTLDHTAYYGKAVLFCGDTLFSAGCGRIFEGTPDMMFNSLNKLLNLSDETKVYCGHEYTLANLYFAQQVEPNNLHITNKIKIVKDIMKQSGCSLPSTIGEEKIINPFFRFAVPEVIESASRYAGRTLSDPVEIFSYLRLWKNEF